MKTIRLGAFETNSSSMHAFIIPRHYYIDHEKNYKIDFRFDKDFTDRKLVPHTSIEDKASYMFQLICQHFNKHFESLYYYDENRNEVEYTGEERTKRVDHNERVIELFKLFQKALIVSAKRNYNIDVTFSSYEISREYVNYRDEVRYVYSINQGDPAIYTGLGCYGHAGVNGVILSSIFEAIDKALETNDFRYFELIVEKDQWFSGACNLFEFIVNPDAIIIQCTDEYTETMKKNMLKLVKEYMKKSNYMCNVVWPIGG